MIILCRVLNLFTCTEFGALGANLVTIDFVLPRESQSWVWVPVFLRTLATCFLPHCCAHEEGHSAGKHIGERQMTDILRVGVLMLQLFTRLCEARPSLCDIVGDRFMDTYIVDLTRLIQSVCGQTERIAVRLRNEIVSTWLHFTTTVVSPSSVNLSDSPLRGMARVFYSTSTLAFTVLTDGKSSSSPHTLSLAAGLCARAIFRCIEGNGSICPKLDRLLAKAMDVGVVCKSAIARALLDLPQQADTAQCTPNWTMEVCAALQRTTSQTANNSVTTTMIVHRGVFHAAVRSISYAHTMYCQSRGNQRQECSIFSVPGLVQSVAHLRTTVKSLKAVQPVLWRHLLAIGDLEWLARVSVITGQNLARRGVS